MRRTTYRLSDVVRWANGERYNQKICDYFIGCRTLCEELTVEMHETPHQNIVLQLSVQTVKNTSKLSTTILSDVGC